MERLIETINVYETDDYQKFITDDKYNRIVEENSQYHVLAKDISEGRQVFPIVVKSIGGKYLIADGQHRFKILVNAGLPIRFYIDNNVNMTEIVNATSLSIPFKTLSFIGMAAEREIPIFMLIKRLLSSNENKLNNTSVIEVVFTYVINKGNKTFSNSILNKDCKKNYEEAFKRYDKPINDDVLKEMYEFIKLIDELAEILDMKKVKVNLVKEALAYHLKHKNNDVTLESIINFLKVEKPSKFSYQVQIKNSSKNQEFKEIFREIALKLSVEKY